MTFKRILSFACVLLLSLSLVSGFVFATVPEAEETADIEDVEEVVAETGHSNCLPDDCYERTEVIEREFLSNTPIRFYGDTSYNGRAWS